MDGLLVEEWHYLEVAKCRGPHDYSTNFEVLIAP